MTGMWRSPHRKAKAFKATADIKLPIGKSARMSGGGQSGTKHRKRHMNAYGPPGTPNGVCTKKDGCNCGGCSVKRRMAA